MGNTGFKFESRISHLHKIFYSAVFSLPILFLHRLYHLFNECNFFIGQMLFCIELSVIFCRKHFFDILSLRISYTKKSVQLHINIFIIIN